MQQTTSEYSRTESHKTRLSGNKFDGYDPAGQTTVSFDVVA